MPGMNGVQVTSEIRSIETMNSKRPALLIAGSASCNTEIKSGFLDAGADFVIEKPFSIYQLSQSIKTRLPLIAA